MVVYKTEFLLNSNLQGIYLIYILQFQAVVVDRIEEFIMSNPIDICAVLAELSAEDERRKVDAVERFERSLEQDPEGEQRKTADLRRLFDEMLVEPVA
jgi:hypothetical protein